MPAALPPSYHIEDSQPSPASEALESPRLLIEALSRIQLAESIRDGRNRRIHFAESSAEIHRNIQVYLQAAQNRIDFGDGSDESPLEAEHGTTLVHSEHQALAFLMQKGGPTAASYRAWLGANGTIVIPRDPTDQVFGIPVPGDVRTLVPALSEADELIGFRHSEGDDPILGATVIRAAKFVIESAHEYCEMRVQKVPMPALIPGEGASVDIVWDRGTRNLLIRVGPEDNPIEVYGFDTDDQSLEIRGKLSDQNNNGWVVYWLMG